MEMTSPMGIVDQGVKEDNSLDIFERKTNISEPTMELINREFFIFKHYQVDVKDMKCLSQWWEKHESMFLIVGFCVKQILGIVGSQIEMERIFSLVGTFASHKECILQSKNLDKLIFANRNWPNDPRIGCKSPSNLVELFETHVDF